MSTRLDKLLVEKGLLSTRSQAESYIRLGKVTVDGRIVNKAGTSVKSTSKISVLSDQYVSRAALKLQSAVEKLGIRFSGKTVLDVGSSTGGFTQYALKKGASRVIAVDVGTDQLHPSLRGNPKIELHEKTDIRDFATKDVIDIVLIDVSFISLTKILPVVTKLAPKAQILAMCKPQFEVGDDKKHKGVIKNETMRRDILRQFEASVKNQFVLVNKADSEVSGAKGNRERFYLLKNQR